MIGVVVVTHGQLATELVNAAEMIVGDLPQFTAVSIGWHDDVNDAREDIAQAIERVRGDAGVLLLTDMFGGTPSNLGMTFLENGSHRSHHRRQPADADQAGGAAQSADLLAVAREMRDHGRNAIWVASDLLRGGEDRAHDVAQRHGRQPARHARARGGQVRPSGDAVSVARPRGARRARDGRQEHHGHAAAGGGPRLDITISADGADEPDAVEALAALVQSDSARTYATSDRHRRVAGRRVAAARSS